MGEVGVAEVMAMGNIAKIVIIIWVGRKILLSWYTIEIVGGFCST